MTNLYIILKRHKINILVYAAFFVVAFVAYYSILNNTFIGDDFDLIDKVNRADFPNLWPLFIVNKVSMRPLVFFILWIQSSFFGNEASIPSHILSVGLHAGCACLLFWLLGKIKVSTTTALLAALMFLLTPVAPEAITWSVVRFDVTVLLFMLLAIGFYAEYLKQRAARFYYGALAASTAAIFSKETAVTLLVLIPALDLLMGNDLVKNQIGLDENDWEKRLKGAAVRLLPFFIPFTIYFSIRYIAIGKVFGSYQNVSFIGIPIPASTAHSFWTLLAPLNNLIFSKTEILSFGGLFLVMTVASLLTVLFRWRHNSPCTRHSWIFLVFFFLISYTPIFSPIFIMGLNNGLRESRYLYIPMMGFISVIIVGLLEFGWKNIFWRMPIVGLLVVSLPISFFCLNQNNRAWERTALISYFLPRETQRLLPDPPPGSKLYFVGVPEWSGAYLYTNGFPVAIRWTYGRPDLFVTNPTLKPGEEIPREPDVFLFAFDEEKEQLTMIRDPQGWSFP
ncbi:MAG: glycosyltransferase family 39 protein [Thermoleophilia bacterium]|nr:glycosyltransferase family 39 protein [Thermoleophilia bacterium]